MLLVILLVAVAIIPLLLGVMLLGIFDRNRLTTSTFYLLLFISIWQLGISSLYLVNYFPKETILIFFKIFRVGPIMAVPSLFYIAYVCFSEYPSLNTRIHLHRFLRVLFSKRSLFVVVTWSLLVYLLNLTNLTVYDLQVYEPRNFPKYYFPVYGVAHKVYLIHMIFLLLVTALSTLVGWSIEYKPLKSFMRNFNISFFVIFISGLLNFDPEKGAMFSSLSILLCGALIVSSFIRMYLSTIVEFNTLAERQKKLDYVGSLVSGLIHQVKNPLSVIKAYSEILPEVQPLNEQGVEMISYIQTATTELNSLIKNYGEFMRTNSYELRSGDLYHVINKSIAIASDKYKDKGVTINFHNKGGTLKISMNEVYLTQAFVNLFTNALEAIDMSSPNKEMSIELKKNSNSILVLIRDTGCGIPKHRWEDVFCAFYTTKSEGTGLGLPLVKRILLGHGGDVCIIASGELGTTIQVSLPRYKLQVPNSSSNKPNN